jgi:hypothetical protein
MAGDVVHETREVTDFERVILEDFGEVNVTQGEEVSLQIEAVEEVMHHIKTEVRDGTLHIEIGRDWLDKIGVAFETFTTWTLKFHLVMKEITGLSVVGAGTIQASDIETDHLSVVLSGAGKIKVDSLQSDSLNVLFPGAGSIEVNGQVLKQKINMTGAGSFNAAKMECKQGSVVLSGVGKAKIWVTEDLDISLTGLGNVEYFGSPKVKKTVSGLGKIKSLGNP